MCPRVQFVGVLSLSRSNAMTSRTRSASLAIAIRVSLAAVWLTGAAAAMAQVTDPLIRRAEMYTGPNEFLLTSESDKQVLSYDSPLDVRVCNRTRHECFQIFTARKDQFAHVTGD